MPHAHVNSKVKTFYLNSKDVMLRNGRKQTIFYFSRESGAGSIEKIPAGYAVGENQRTGLPFLKRDPAAGATPKQA
jgi:hypothetical protein